MKKLLATLLLITSIASCSHQGNQTVSLKFSAESEKETMGAGKTIEITAIDNRQSKDSLGTAKFGKEKFTIKAQENLVEVLKDQIASGLENKGFKIAKGKKVEVHLENFEYYAKRKFPIGKAKIKAEIKIIVHGKKAGEKFTKNFSISSKNKFFLAPSQEDNIEVINSNLKELVEDVLSDKALLDNLVK